MVEFDCEGCGMHVFAVGLDAPPPSGFCGTCAWLCEFVTDPQEIEQLRRAQGLLNPTRPGRGDETLTPEARDAR